VPREAASKIPPSAAEDFEFSKEGSPEDHFWEFAADLSQRGVSRSRSAQLLKLNFGDIDAALAQLRQAAGAREPSPYLSKIIANLKTEQAPIATAGQKSDEPEFVREHRADGRPIEPRPDGTWRIAGQIYNHNGQIIGW
jgi:hypothetical protein